MPQVTALPPPYSRDWSCLPPPIQRDVDHRVWAVQLAFENAREIVRYAVLTTFTLWMEDWPLKGKDIPRTQLQQTYSLAPEDLKLAIDWQLKWDRPALIRTDHIRRCLDYHRQVEEGTYEETLSPSCLEQDFDAAPPDVQYAVVATFAAWYSWRQKVQTPRPSRSELVDAYKAASQPLKAAISFVLELGITWFVECAEDIEEHKRSIQQVIDFQKTEMRRWDMMGRTVGRW